MADIILVYPKWCFGKEIAMYMPLSLLCVATPLVREGYDVEIFDLRIEGSEGKLLEEVKKKDVSCVGVSMATSGPQIHSVLNISRKIKEIRPHIPIVLGGVHPSLLPDETLRSPYLDLVVIGEGEETFRELIECLQTNGERSKIEGLAFRNGDGVIKTPQREFIDLNESPSLAYELLDIERYTNNTLMNIRERALPLMTSRGCPYRCTYCYSKSFNRRRWRAMKTAKVMEYMRALTLNFKLSGIHLFDDEFFIDRGRVEEICQTMLREKHNLHIFNANIRINEILAYKMESLDLLKRVGFERLFVGVESGSDEILRKVQKGITVSEVLEANRKLEKVGIKPFYSFMIGFPFERAPHIKKTIGLMNKLLTEYPGVLLYGANLYTPYPGTPLYDSCLKEGIPLPKSLAEWIEYQGSDRYLAHFPRKEQNLLKKAVILSCFIDYKSFKDPLGATDQSKLKYLLKRLYSWIIRIRVRLNFYFGMWELSFLQQNK